MSERNRNPDPHPLLARLSKPESAETEDVISIVGFVGTRDPDGPLRLFADEEGQRYLDIPFDHLVDSEPVPYDDRGRTRVFVKRGLMTDNAFEAEDVLPALEEKLLGPPMSLWQFLPQNRLVAADMLGMLPEYERPRYEKETA